MKKLVLIVGAVLMAGSLWAQAYVGPEKCLQCHSNAGLGDMTGWRTSMHANGYSAVLDDTHSMENLNGIINDYDENGTDDFKDGLDFNAITSAFDTYKPNAPVLGYNATDGYTIKMGDVTHKVILTYGGSGLYKQRYVLKVMTSEGYSAGYYVSPVQFNEKTKEYVVYHGSDWYDGNTPKYTSASTLADIAGNSRSLAKNCSGCHTAGLDLSQDANGEWLMSGAPVENEALYTGLVNYYDIDGDGDLDQINTTCERCHGPGGDHVLAPSPSNIINPAALTSEQANNLCGMCHSRGKSKPNNTFGFPFHDDTMMGWTTGDLVEPIYTDGGGYWGDEKTSVQHHQQFLDFYRSGKPTFEFHEVTCYECHDVHNTEKHHIRTEIEEEDSTGAPLMIATENDNNTLCLSCHATHGAFESISKEMVADYDNNVAAIGAIVSEHSHHPYDPTGTNSPSRCSKCHMAKTAKSAIAYDIHGHTFEPIPPEKTENFSMPNSCAASCHMKDGLTFGIDFSNDNLTDWGESSDLQLAAHLKQYYGPAGTWWVTVTSVHLTDLENPTEYSLNQNYPNPFNPSTTISFSVPRASHVMLNIYSITGELVSTLLDKDMSSGNYVVEFDGSELSSGVYLYSLVSDNFVSTKKMALVK